MSDNDIATRHAGNVTTAEASRAAIGYIVNFVAARRALYANLLSPTALQELAARITHTFPTHSVEAFYELPVKPSGADPVITAQFIAGGILNVLNTWLTDSQHPLKTEQLICRSVCQ